MKLIPGRKKSPTTFERATGFVKLGVKGLVVQRAARRVLKTYKFARRAIPLALLAVIGVAVAKKVRGRNGPSAAGGYTPPQTGSGNVAGGGTSGMPPVNGEKADSAYDRAEQGETPTDGELQVEGPNESTPPPPEKTKK